MFKKIILGFRILLPFVINVFLFLIIFDPNNSSEYALTDALFFLGIIDLSYGVAALFIIRRPNNLYFKGNNPSVVNLALAEQNIKDHHRGDTPGYLELSIKTKYLRFIYIILGILICIAATVVYIL